MYYLLQYIRLHTIVHTTILRRILARGSTGHYMADSFTPLELDLGPSRKCQPYELCFLREQLTGRAAEISNVLFRRGEILTVLAVVTKSSMQATIY